MSDIWKAAMAGYITSLAHHVIVDSVNIWWVMIIVGVMFSVCFISYIDHLRDKQWKSGS